MTQEKIVGHKTMIDGSHQPLYETEAKVIWNKCLELKAKRAADMPTEKEALQVLGQAYERLKELGFKTAYGAENNKEYDVIEAGSTGIHTATYEGKWPTGSWWIHDGETWPSRPILYREKPSASIQKAEPKEGE